jgi:hypothetical protein
MRFFQNEVLIAINIPCSPQEMLKLSFGARLDMVNHELRLCISYAFPLSCTLAASRRAAAEGKR